MEQQSKTNLTLDETRWTHTRLSQTSLCDESTSQTSEVNLFSFSCFSSLIRNENRLDSSLLFDLWFIHIELEYRCSLSFFILLISCHWFPSMIFDLIPHILTFFWQFRLSTRWLICWRRFEKHNKFFFSFWKRDKTEFSLNDSIDRQKFSFSLNENRIEGERGKKRKKGSRLLPNDNH